VPPPAEPPAAAATRAEPPPLDPPAPLPASTGPSFLKPRDTVEAARRDRPEQDGRAVRPADESAPASDRPPLPRDFVLRASPWVDFSLTNVWIDERVSNFLNLGVQVGGYFFERMRVTGRLVAPLEEMADEQGGYYFSGNGSYFINGRSRSVSLLYGASIGLIVASSRTFVFAPGILLMRTDVEDYGTSLALSLPFEWTTARHLRVGFELGLGQGMGGTQAESDGIGDSGGREQRPSGTFVLLQFQMGASLARP
jgi:hypothetical protein